jgi:tetratricopeptide (TPR) repeat protein
MEKKPSKYKIQKQEIPEFDLSPEVERLQNQLDRDPNSKVFLPLAEEYRRSKMTEEAIFVLEEGIKRNPTYSAAKIALTRAYLEINEIMKAKKAIDEILNIMPHHPLALKLHGDISFREGDFLEARKAYEIVKQLNPMDSEVDQKLSELQVGVSGSKIEVASISEHEEDMQIERASSEHKAPAQMAIPANDDNQAFGDFQTQSQFQDNLTPPVPVAPVYQENVQPPPIGYEQPVSPPESAQYADFSNTSPAGVPQFTDNAPFNPVSTQPEVYSTDSEYANQAFSQQQFQSDQFQAASIPAGLPGAVNYSQENIPPVPQVMEGVPLVSHEAVMPDRLANQQGQYFHRENQDMAGSLPDVQQAQNYQRPNQPDVSVDDIFKVPADSGGFYTGPPTDPYVDQYGKGYSEGKANMANPLTQETPSDSQNITGYEFPQLANSNIPEAIPDSSFSGFAQDQTVQPHNAVPSMQDINVNPGTGGQSNRIDFSQSGGAPVPHDEFRLNELEAEVDIPMPGKIEMNVDLKQQQMMQEQQSVPMAGEERITIDSLDISELNVEEMAKKYGTQESPQIKTQDIASEISSQYNELDSNVLVDNIFKQSQASQISVASSIQNEQSDVKYNMDLAELYTKQGHFDKALDIYKILLAAQPDNQEIINRLIDTEKKKNSAQLGESTNVSPTERIAKMEEWFRTLLKDKKEGGN